MTAGAVVVELSPAYSRQLGRHAAVSRRLTVTNVSAGAQLTTVDSVQNNTAALNVTWAMHTQARVVFGGGRGGSVPAAGTVVLMQADRTAEVKLVQALPAGEHHCGPWQVEEVVLPADPPRYPVGNVRKLSVTCAKGTTLIEVAIQDA